MEKPTTITAAEKLLAELLIDEQNFIFKNITAPVHDYKKKLLDENRFFLNQYTEKISEVKKVLRELKETRKKLSDIHPNIEKWLQQVYSVGVNWGYGGIKVSYVHPENLFIIVTNKGGTAGTGTAMGTGGYYYANTSHWVVFPQYNKLHGYGHRAEMPSGSKLNQLFTQDGRLTHAVKNHMIVKAEEYVNQYNIKPFDPETLLQKKGLSAQT